MHEFTQFFLQWSISSRKCKCAGAQSLAKKLQSVSPTDLGPTLSVPITRDYAQFLCFTSFSKISINFRAQNCALILKWSFWAEKLYIQLNLILSLKQESIFCTKRCALEYLGFAQKVWWNWPLFSFFSYFLSLSSYLKSEMLSCFILAFSFQPHSWPL